MIPTPEDTTSPVAPSQTSTYKPHRALACELCQRRKVRCDRQSPCGNCVKANAQCVQVAQPRQRRRRFAERDLLERLRAYEGLLRNNNIAFEALHSQSTEVASPAHSVKDSAAREELEGGDDARKAAAPAAGKIEAVNLWNAMNQKSTSSQSDDEDNDEESVDLATASRDKIAETVVNQTFDQLFESHDSLLFGNRVKDIDTKALHPPSGQILKLWQIYLDNVNPLLKVTHTPTLQPRIIDAAVNLANVPAGLEALMFGIYCVAILSLDEAECRRLFGSSQDSLVQSYVFACKQAMIKTAVLRSRDRESLTALFLYLISFRPGTDPRALAPLLGIAVRLAQRMGLDNDFELAKCSPLEAELRRRLWWSLVMFDNRMCEMSHHGSTSLLPTWQCTSILNVNDADLLPDSKVTPQAHERPTEAIFAVVRSEVGNFARDSAFHLSFTNPALMPLAKDAHLNDTQRHARLASFEETIERRYLRLCNADDPLHTMTLWSTRTLLARLHVLQYYATSATNRYQVTGEQRDTAVWHAMRMIECDTNLANAPMVRGFSWHVHAHFPAVAYIHIIQDMRKRPTHQHAQRCWEVLNDNFMARWRNLHPGMSPFFDVLSRALLQAWDGYEAALGKIQASADVPPIVDYVRQKASSKYQTTQSMKIGLEQVAGSNIVKETASNQASFWMPATSFFGGVPPSSQGIGGFPDMSGEDGMDFDLSQFDLTTMDWNPLLALGGTYSQ